MELCRRGMEFVQSAESLVLLGLKVSSRMREFAGYFQKLD